MRSLWVKIGLGATGVFMVGMMGLTLVRNAKAAAVEAFHDAVNETPAKAVAALAAVEAGRSAPSVEQLASLRQLQQVGGGADFTVDLPFRLDGDQLGTMASGTIRRARANALPTMSLEVELTDADARARLEDCVLVPERHRDADFGGGFRCASSSDAGLVTFGTVRFNPGHFSRPLMITSAQADDLRKGEPFEARADMRGGVQVDASGDKGGMVRVRADEGGANIRIHDENGNDIFRLLADSLGASLRVRDKNGKEIVRLSAGDGRFSLTVDTTGH